jgi:hypothetical protein
VEHRPSERVALEWEIAPESADADPTGGLRPVVGPDFVHVLGLSALLAPQWLVHDREPRPIRLRWRGFEREGWCVTSSHGSAPELRFDGSLREFCNASFVAGALGLERREILGGHLLVAAPRSPRTPAMPELADALARIADKERARFHDEPKSFLLVCVLPVEAPSNEIVARSSADGISLFHSRAVAPLDLRGKLLDAFALESFRVWCGEEIILSSVVGQDLWFGEGFSRFYAGRMLRAADLTTREQRRAEIEHVLSAYAASPWQGLDNEAIAERFFGEDEVFDLAWRRGYLIALVLDAEMRRVSGGVRSLDDGLRELLAETRAGRASYRTEELLARCAAWTDTAFARRMGEWIQHGGPFPFEPPSLAEPP